MNLTELQIELRNIEEHISQLHSKIESMKPQTDEEKKTAFETITKMAKRHPISHRGIIDAPELLKREFVSSLSYLLCNEEKDVYTRLLYLNRLVIGCGLNMSADDIYKSGLEFEGKDIEKICNDLQPYKYSYLIEAFIIANLSEEASVNILTVIADMAKIMGCDTEEIRVLAQTAKCKLIGDMELLRTIPLPSKNRWSGKLAEYVPKEWIVSQRKECAIICTKKNTKKESGSIYNGSITDPFARANAHEIGSGIDVNYNTEVSCVVKNRPSTGSVVKKGDSILVYEEQVKKKTNNQDFLLSKFWTVSRESEEAVKETRTIVAPTDGIVFFVEKKKKGEVAEQEDKYLAVYVVSFFDEYKDFCKWFASR